MAVSISMLCGKPVGAQDEESEFERLCATPAMEVDAWGSCDEFTLRLLPVLPFFPAWRGEEWRG
jgi:hypothetical protein